MNFEQRVELAQDRLEGGLVWGEGPVLDELDAAIVLVGHSYRRDAHHYDTHNPAVIGPLGRVMFAAVAPMFTRSQSRALYIGHPQAVRDELARYGGIRKGWRRSATVRHVPRRRCSLVEGTERHARPHRVLAASRRPTAS